MRRMPGYQWPPLLEEDVDALAGDEAGGDHCAAEEKHGDQVEMEQAGLAALLGVPAGDKVDGFHAAASARCRGARRAALRG